MPRLFGQVRCLRLAIFNVMAGLGPAIHVFTYSKRLNAVIK
jgi:hypothetical protein